MRARSGSRHRLSTRLVGGGDMVQVGGSKLEGKTKMRKKEQRQEEK